MRNLFAILCTVFLCGCGMHIPTTQSVQSQNGVHGSTSVSNRGVSSKNGVTTYRDNLGRKTGTATTNSRGEPYIEMRKAEKLAQPLQIAVALRPIVITSVEKPAHQLPIVLEKPPIATRLARRLALLRQVALQEKQRTEIFWERRQGHRRANEFNYYLSSTYPTI